MEIKNVIMKLRLESGLQVLHLIETEKTEKRTVYIFEKQGEPAAEGRFIVEKHDAVTVFSAQVQLSQSAFRENDSLTAQAPVLISFEPDERPEKICAQYQHRDWWSRPYWGKAYEMVPERTQSMFIQYRNSYGCFLPMAGDKTKSYIQGERGSENTVFISMTAYTAGLHRIEDICLLYSEGADFFQNAAEVWKKACHLRNVPDVSSRKYPEMFEYLGWCSWDAFYTDITEQKVREKVDELNEKSVPARWILLDDGWLSISDQRLYSLEPEKSKFPDGFANMTRDIKNTSMITKIGVWHAFGGYWGGVLARSEAAKECCDNLYKTKNEKLIPHFDPDKGFGFWRKWYTYLREQGIDFTKVDGQSALKNYYRHNEEIGKVAKGAHQSLEAASALYMDGNLINCMGMAVENLLSRPASGLSRNSDDFVPEDENGFQEHLLQNAYNALYHSWVYHCDWDMFWTEHRDSRKHALLRAASGGPVYISDPIGKTVPEEIKPLVYHDGRILRMDRCALPYIDCIFESPLEGNNLTLTNTVNGAAVAALFHIGEKEDAVTTCLKASRIYELEAEAFLVYRYFEGACELAGDNDNVFVTLEKGAYDLIWFIPKRKGITPIGLVDKYMCYHSLENIETVNGSCVATLRDGGRFSFHADYPVTGITVNGSDMTNELKQAESVNCYCIDLSHLKGRITVRIQ